MFGLFKKTIRKDAQVAVCTGDQVVSVARVRRDKNDTAPVLDLCEAQIVENISLEDAEIARLAHHHQLDQYECVSTLEPGNYSLLLVEAPDVQPEELRAAVRWRIKDLIDFHIDDAVVDVFEIPHQKAAGRNKMMYAVAARTDVVKNRIDQLVDAGLHLNVIDIPELALRNIAVLLPEDAAGVVLVYIAQDSGLIIITRQSRLYLSRSINTGTNDLTDAGDPEQVKSWLDAIIIEVQRSLDYYESHYSQPQASALVIAPLTIEVPGMTDYMASQLGIPARILDVNHLIDMPELLTRQQQAQCLLAIGAALRQETMAL